MTPLLFPSFFHQNFYFIFVFRAALSGILQNFAKCTVPFLGASPLLTVRTPVAPLRTPVTPVCTPVAPLCTCHPCHPCLYPCCPFMYLSPLFVPLSPLFVPLLSLYVPVTPVSTPVILYPCHPIRLTRPAFRQRDRG